MAVTATADNVQFLVTQLRTGDPDRILHRGRPVIATETPSSSVNRFVLA